MKIQSTSNITFGSENHPLKPVTLYDKAGEPVCISEIRKNDKFVKKDINEVAKFIWAHQDRLFQNRLNIPETEQDAYDSINKMDWLNDIKKYLLGILNKEDGNTTILVAKNKNHKIIGSISLQNFDDKLKSINLSDSKIGYIDNAIINHHNYKNCQMGLEQALLHNVSEAARGHFTDIISGNELFRFSHNLYESLGFEYLPQNGDNKIKVLENKLYSVVDNLGTIHVKSLDAKNSGLKRLIKQIK